MRTAYADIPLPEEKYRALIQFSVDPALLLKYLRDAAVNQGVRFFILDTLFDALNVEDINNYATMKPVMGTLTRFCRQYNCHILCVHHDNKTSRGGSQDGILGSQAIAGSSSHNINVWCEEGKEGHPRYIRSRNRYPEGMGGKVFKGEQFYVTPTACWLSSEQAETPAQKKLSKHTRALHDMFLFVWSKSREQQPVSKREILEHITGIDDKAKRDMLNEYLDQETFVYSDKKKNGHPLIIIHDKFLGIDGEDAAKDALIKVLQSAGHPLFADETTAVGTTAA
jgi:hypothetical protein